MVRKGGSDDFLSIGGRNGRGDCQTWESVETGEVKRKPAGLEEMWRRNPLAALRTIPPTV